MTTPSQAPAAEAVVERALRAAGRAGDHVSTSVIVEDDSTANLRWACNTLTTNGYAESRQVWVVTAVRGSGGVGVAGVGGSADGSQVEDLVEQALAQARQAPAAEDARDLPPGSQDVDFALAADPLDPNELSPLTPQLGAELETFAAADAELFGFAEQTRTTTWLGTSAGARRRHVQPSATVELTAKSHQRSRSTYDNRTADRLADVDLASMAAGLRTRLDWQARRVNVQPGRYSTILPAGSVLDLLIHLYWEAGARAAHEGETALSKPGGGTRVGETVSNVGCDLISDPSATGLEVAPFLVTAASSPLASVFDNGLDLRRTAWIDDGRLSALPGSRFAAGLAGLPAHPQIDNLALNVRDGQGTIDDLIASTERGLLVTSLWYIREVDPMTMLLTGLTRDGVYLVENGEVVGLTGNFRFNDSPLGLLNRVEAAGVSAPALSREWSDWFTRSAAPALRVADFNMSTSSAGT
ncbi:MAG: metallopeptidase TldD-related protein [Actinomycetales bacterium]